MEKIFNSKLICIKEGSLMSEAKALMSAKRIRHLPVLNSQNEITSMLSSYDIAQADQFQNMSVALFASFPVQYVTDETPLSKVALIMLEKKISSVILCDSEKKAVGIITTDDLLLQFSQMMGEIEKKGKTEITQLDLVVGAGEFFRRLSNIGI